MTDRLRVAVIGAGRWSRSAHLPGFKRSPLAEIVSICDFDRELAEARAAEFDVPDVVTNAEEVLARDDVDVVDVVTRGDHQDLVFQTLEAGKHCLVEKPVCHDFRDVRRAHELARSKGLKTKVGLTFRYAPAVMYMFDLIREGFVGKPFILNGFEQNGAIQVRLVEEHGETQTIRTAKPDAVEFVQREIPERYFAPGAQPDDDWSTAFYGNLVHDFCQEILDGGERNQGDFAQSARVQEVINAVALSHRRRAWVDLPLGDDVPGGQQSPY